MKKAAIVIDDWKLKIFKKILDEGGFKYTEHNGPVDKCITLNVETESVAKLQPFVVKANNKAAQYKCLN